MEPEWKEPPAPRAGTSRRQDIDKMVDKLKERPGEWALVATNSSPSVASWKARGCDTKTVTAGLGYVKSRCDIYARWPVSTGPQSPRKPLPVNEEVEDKNGKSDAWPPKRAGVVPATEDMPW